ncbi:MAG: hypothetical protein WDM88_11460 [Galbitalea sp.]
MPDTVNAAPILNAAGMYGTYYTNSGNIGLPGYQTRADLSSLYAAGNEIAGPHGQPPRPHDPVERRGETPDLPRPRQPARVGISRDGLRLPVRVDQRIDRCARRGMRLQQRAQPRRHPVGRRVHRMRLLGEHSPPPTPTSSRLWTRLTRPGPSPTSSPP